MEEFTLALIIVLVPIVGILAYAFWERRKHYKAFIEHRAARRSLIKSAERYMKSDEYKQRSTHTGQKTVERLRKFTEQLETDPELARRILNQTPFEQSVNKAINGSL
ncbi:hypothetical protein [Gimesia maris]|uniref:hypothetical protein n=1 Tax=Gimesia maris TaxID=122 RepID=UPI0032EFB109